jgi:anthranilate phosphoribosyltransferase
MTADSPANALSPADLWPQLLTQLMDGQSLSQDQAQTLMQGWLGEEIPEVLSGGILVALQTKGIEPEELAGMARVLQSQAQGAQSALGAQLIDTCGTGGDGAGSFNVSTAVAFVAAAAGIAVAKHGNRSASSRVGSADVLEYLGVNLGAGAEPIQAALKQVGITFLFAPGWHPALKSVASLRRTLKVRTVFNLLGPLVNPLRPGGQVVGVYSPRLVLTMAQALQILGTPRAIALHGREKIDEASLGDVTDLAVLAQGQVQKMVLDPAELGLAKADLGAIAGGDVPENAAILTNVLQGKGTQAQRDVVALNAALAIAVSEEHADKSYDQTLALAQSVIASGAAWDKLQQLVRFLAAESI